MNRSPIRSVAVFALWAWAISAVGSGCEIASEIDRTRVVDGSGGQGGEAGQGGKGQGGEAGQGGKGQGGEAGQGGGGGQGGG